MLNILPSLQGPTQHRFEDDRIILLILIHSALLYLVLVLHMQLKASNDMGPLTCNEAPFAVFLS